MDIFPQLTGGLIQHETIAHVASRAKVTIGPKSKCPSPGIKINKNGDTIESIEVSCSCGETILIQCDYV